MQSCLQTTLKFEWVNGREWGQDGSDHPRVAAVTGFYQEAMRFLWTVEFSLLLAALTVIPPAPAGQAPAGGHIQTLLFPTWSNSQGPSRPLPLLEKHPQVWQCCSQFGSNFPELSQEMLPFWVCVGSEHSHCSLRVFWELSVRASCHFCLLRWGGGH